MVARVLIIRLSSFGDIVQTFPCVDYLKRKVEVHYLTKEKFKPLVALHPDIAQIHTLSDHPSLKELLHKASELKKFQYQAVFDLHRNLRSRTLLFALNLPNRKIQKSRFKEYFLYFFRRSLFNKLKLQPLNRSQEALRVVKEIFPCNEEDKLRQSTSALVVSEILPDFIQGFIANQPQGYICICPESAWKEKEWGLQRFVQLAKQVINNGYGVIWLGIEKGSFANFGSKSLDLIGKLSLTELATVLKQARLLVCNDSGLMHLAERLGTPAVSIFGPTSPELGFAPALPKSRIVQTNLWCRPCSKTGKYCFRFQNQHKCLSDITVPMVWGAIEDSGL